MDSEAEEKQRLFLEGKVDGESMMTPLELVRSSVASFDGGVSMGSSSLAATLGGIRWSLAELEWRVDSSLAAGVGPSLPPP